MHARLISLFAETSIHPGAEAGAGFVDLPVAREAATDCPVIPGSSLKGALAGLAREHSMQQNDLERIFGRADHAGGLLVSDARLLLLPVRSLQSAYKWITCPYLLERLDRDLRRAGIRIPSPLTEITPPAPGRYLAQTQEELFLEERLFTHQATCPDGLLQTLQQLLPDPSARKRLPQQLVVLEDGDFAWFARYGLPIQARNVLDPERKTSQNLWYEESIPPDALFYAILAERTPGAAEPLWNLLQAHPYLQVGGNETVGMGWFQISVHNSQEPAS
ncbi:type III-B CRISPR module RAMP protein Cmr4 [Limisphaera sp. VF-2]|uniref:type III-B CRISPR module RAMP protein Cmr4 n=1 Tax=Limisphaera sp. VF-2 TaxID=3400418 RepID=UPI00176B7A73